MAGRKSSLHCPCWITISFALYKAWFAGIRLIVLDRVTEILRQRDLEVFMDCVQLLLGQGSAVFLLDLDEGFMYRYAGRVDVIKNRKLCYHLYPEEYDERLYEILGWEHRSGVPERENTADRQAGAEVLRVTDLLFPSMAPLSFAVRGGEIAFLRDENYNTANRILDCFLGDTDWISGSFRLCGQEYSRPEMLRKIGTEIGIQIKMPDRKDGVLFDDLTALDNLCLGLIPKAGKHVIRRPLVDSILDAASEWFDREGAAPSHPHVVHAAAAAALVFQVVSDESQAADLSVPVCGTGAAVP